MARRRSHSTKRRKQLQLENLETRELLAADFMQTNLVDPTDVDNDGATSPRDVLMIVNALNSSTVEFETGDPPLFMDVNNDSQLSPTDALRVINRLNSDAADRANPADRARPAPQEDSEPNSPTADTPTDEDATAAESQAVASDPVLAWNTLFNELLVNSEDYQNPGYASRSMAMLNVAIYDAVSLATGNDGNTFYEYDAALTDQASNLSPEVAASQAAYTVLSSLYPEQQATIDAFREDGDQRQNGRTRDSVNLGEAVASTVLSERANDGADGDVTYEYSDASGYFQVDPLNPDAPIWGPAWRYVDTFAISSTDEFTPDSPPDLSSEEYAISYNEVKELGSVDSATRTADEMEAGIFWAYDREGLGTPLSLFNDVLVTIAVQEGNTFEENATLFAQASVSMADAAIVSWETKFDNDFWRPVTAIHAGDADGNTLTQGDESWTALGAPDGGEDIVGFTPQFPTYISGHATFGGALFGAIREFYGTDDIAFDLESTELEILLENPELQEAYGLDLDDATRSFSSLSEAMAENGRSRVYLGIHFDFDDLVGQEVGQEIATAVSSEFAVPSEANAAVSEREAATDQVFAELPNQDDSEDDDRDRRRRRG